MEIKTILITQARTGSTRLPGKVLKEINGTSLLETHLKRLAKCTRISEIIVATTDNDEDAVICQKALAWGFQAFRGSENDVLDRFYQSVKDKKADWIVRVTSDCPLIDPILVDQVVQFAQENDCDYVSNGLLEMYPDGQDVEVFKFSALKMAWEGAKLNSEREHVTPYIRTHADFNNGHLFKALNYPSPADYSTIRMTVDEPADFEVIEMLIQNVGTEQSWFTYTNYIIDHQLGKLNEQITRNEGFIKSLKND